MKNKHFITLGLLVSSFGPAAVAQKSYDISPIKLQNHSSKEETMPVYSKAHGKLYFTRIFDQNNIGGETGGHDIYSVQVSNNKFGTLSHDFPALNTLGNNAVVGTSVQGDTIFLLGSYDERWDYMQGLSYAVNEDGAWSEPKQLKIKGFNPKSFIYGMYVHPTGKVLVLSMENRKSVGQEDLYICLREKPNVFGKPIHLATNINTSGAEFAPFLSADQQTLYFSSTGLPGKGDADIFKVTRKGDSWTDWTDPEALPEPVNSDKFDAYYNEDESGKFFFMASNRSNEYTRLYTGKVSEQEKLLAKQEPKQKFEKFVDSTPMQPADSADVEETTKITENKKVETLQPTKSKQVEKAVAIKEEVKKPIKKQVKTTTKAVEKAKAEVKSTPGTFNVASFEYNNWQLNSKSKKLIEEFMLKNPKRDTKIEVIGYADNKGSERNNILVSKRRAQAVARMLMDKGYANANIKVTAKGSQNPIASNLNETDRAKNRRVEIVVR